jgi:NADPH2:quinone reductase
VDGDFGINLDAVLNVLKTSGTIATYSSVTIPEPILPFRQMLFMDLTIRIVLVYAMPKEAKLLAIKDITEALKTNSLKHSIAATYPLIDSSAAHEAIEKGNNYGCVVITI